MTDTEYRPADCILFRDLCNVLEELSKWKKQKQKQEKILEDFINDFRLKAAATTTKKNVTFFPILRLLLPNCERERSAYNLKEIKLGQLLVRVLALKKESQDGKKLLNFRSVQNSSQDSDFAGVAYFVLKNRVGQRDGSLTIAKVNELLDKIAAADVGNKGPNLDEVFRYVMDNCSAEQMKWFLRIVLKELKLGIGVGQILCAFHPDAPEHYETCGNLSKVCEELEDGNTRPLELGIQVFFAISPMLSQRMDMTHIGQLPPNGTYCIENKFDGERFQIHMKDGVFEYFSRKGFTYSDNYGKTYEYGLLTPKLKNCFSPSVTSFILDGEMMGWHKQHQCFSSKGMAFDVKKITDSSKFSPCFCAFDLLYYNGKPLVGPQEKGGEPLTNRLVLLKSMFTDVPGVIQHSKVQYVNNSFDILEALNKAIDDEEEGIVVKDIKSFYIPNKRNAGWYKIKPEYTESTMEDLDLVIIGAEEAENKKQGRARSFHVACADAVEPGAAPHRWVCVSRVATGLKYEERERICAELEKHWVPSKRESPPSCLHFHKQKPDFWVLPEHSIVLQVRATELIQSTDYGTAYTLRFPRVVRLREDKPVKDALTLDEFNNLVANKGSVVKLSTKHINKEQIGGPETKIRKKRNIKELKVAEHLRTKVAGDVEMTSRALFGKEICILSDDEDCKKQELIRMVQSHGGKHVENIGPNTWCSVAGRKTRTVRSKIASQTVDIVPTSWLRSLPPSDTTCVLSPLDFLATSKKTKMALRRNYDRFGDSYTEPLDEEALQSIFSKMGEEHEIYLTTQEMLRIDKKLFGDNNPFSYLRPCFIHHPNPESVQAFKAKLYGATLCELDSPNLTHAIVQSGISVEDAKNVKRTINAFLVSEEWLETCFLENKMVSEKKYVLL